MLYKKINIMKKIIFYGFVLIVVYNLLGVLWNKITFDKDEEVLKFNQKIEILKSSKDFYDLSNTSRKYLSFLNENIDWFTAEQSKAISTELNYLRDYANSKIDSIDNARAAKKEDERKKKENEERKKKENEERKNKKSKIKNNVKKNDVSYRSCGWCGDSFVKGKGYNTYMRMINQPDMDYSYYCTRKCATEFLQSTN